MPRLIRHEHTGPIKIEPQDKPVFICGCGLTKNFPFCDGSHKACKDEEPEALYIYESGQRKIVKKTDPD